MKQPKILIRYGLLAAAFVVCLSLIPASMTLPKTFDISPDRFHDLLLLFELPLIVVWLTAFYSQSKLARYASSITGSMEEPAFRRLAIGCRWLAVGLPVTALIQLAIYVLSDHFPGMHQVAIVTGNYISMLFPLVAFYYMAAGTSRLLMHKSITSSTSQAALKQAFLAITGIVFCFLLLSHLDIRGTKTYFSTMYIPLWLFIVSVLLPYLFAWFSGLLAAFDMLLIAKAAPGLLYRQALQSLAVGVSVVILSLIILQYQRLTLPTKTALDLSSVLLSIYAVYCLAVAGFVMIANGAGKLLRIEEV